MTSPDIVQARIDDEADEARSALFAAIVVRYNVLPADLLKEIEGAGILARIARDILAWPEPEKPRRGRPPNTRADWTLYLAVSSARHNNKTIDGAIREIASRHGDDPEDKEFARLEKSYERAVKRWGRREKSTPVQLSEFFGPIPKGRET